MTESIEHIWNELVSAGSFPSHRRVSAEHPLDLYAEISSDGQPGLLVISSEEPPVPPHYESVKLELGRRFDGRWAMQIILTKSELRPLFVHLCNALLEEGNSFVPVSQSGAFVLGRLAKWRRMLILGTYELLSESEVRGLIGELLFLRTVLPVYGLKPSVDAWNGPFDAPQDFTFTDRSFEIKTVSRGDVAVQISSLDQLDITGDVLTLVIYEFSGINANGADGFTLPSIIEEIRALLELEVEVAEKFEIRLPGIKTVRNIKICGSE